MAHDPQPNPQDVERSNSPPEFVKNLPKRLFNPRDDMLRVSRQLKRDVELLSQMIAELERRVRHLEGHEDSPP